LEGVDLDDEVRRVDPDRWLASRFIDDQGARAGVIALYAFDYQLARAGTAASNPLIARIRLTWWGEGVDEVFAGGAIRIHPTLEAVASAIWLHDLPRQPFDTMIQTRVAALDTARFEPDAALAWARGAQGELAGLAARVLGGSPAQHSAKAAGVVWGLILLRRAGKAGGRDFDARLRQALGEAARDAASLDSRAFPAALAATLARAELKSRPPSDLEKRGRLVWAALAGRL
jgi:15-cis-phytoene synthase